MARWARRPGARALIRGRLVAAVIAWVVNRRKTAGVEITERIHAGGLLELLQIIEPFGVYAQVLPPMLGNRTGHDICHIYETHHAR